MSKFFRRKKFCRFTAEGVTEIEDAECVEISYPGFFDQLEALAEC